MPDRPKTLAEQCEQVKHDFIANLSPEARQDVATAFEHLLASNAGESAVGVGDQAPDFSLPDLNGQQRRLSDLLERGPLVLSFYRGGWCPFCNLEFRALMDHLTEIESQGATLVGISPELPDAAAESVRQNGITFEVLSDAGNRVIRQWGLVSPVDEAIRPHYLQWGINLPAVNGDASYELPIPATYVIDRQGRIRAACINKDYTQRMEPAEIIDALKRL